MKEKDIIFHLNEEFQLNSCSNSKVYELENNVSKIIIKCKPMEGFVYKLHREQYSEKSFVVMKKTENGVEYLLDNAFLSKQGIFWLQLSATSADQQYISNSVKLSVGRYINATEEPTPEQTSEIDKLLVKAEVLAEKADTLETLDVEEIEGGIRVHFNGVDYDIFNGEQGDKGDPFTYEDFTPEQLEALKGKDGLSPSARVFQLRNGARIVIEDSSGTTYAEVLNGEGTTYNLKWDGKKLTHKDKEIQYTREIVDVIERDGLTPIITDSARNVYHLVKIELTPQGDYNLIFSGIYEDDLLINLNQLLVYEYDFKVNVSANSVQLADNSHLAVLNTKFNKLNSVVVKSVNGNLPDEEGNVEISTGGSDVIVEDNPEGGVDIDNGTTRKTVATQDDLSKANEALSKLPTDVQINGTSILDENKVANVPYAGRNISGVVKANTSFGFSTSTEGELQVYNEDSFINARLVRTPLALNKLDYAVKQAMCDGKGAEWTDTEKESARSRLGIVTLTQEEYDLIEVKNESTIYVIVG